MDTIFDLKALESTGYVYQNPCSVILGGATIVKADDKYKISFNGVEVNNVKAD